MLIAWGSVDTIVAARGVQKRARAREAPSCKMRAMKKMEKALSAETKKKKWTLEGESSLFSF